MLFTGRRLPLRPEDDNEGEIEQGTGEIGFFSPHSWWPLFLGLGAATAALGFAVGWWLFLIGMLFTVFASIGFVFEYYRGTSPTDRAIGGLRPPDRANYGEPQRAWGSRGPV